MEIDIAYLKLNDGVWVASPRGSIESASSEEFGREIHKLLQGEVRHLLLDMAEVRYISSMGLGTLIEIMKKSTARGSSFHVYDPQLPVKRVLEISKLDFVQLKPENLAPDQPFAQYIRAEEPKRAQMREKKLKEKEEAEKRFAKEKSKKK
jgi:anti-sigma B factor antagonist